MEKHNLELNSACSSNYLEPHTNNSNKRAFDYEHANSAMNYKVAEEELVVSTYKSYNLQRGFSQKYSRLRCLLRVKGLVIGFYLGWSGHTLLIRKI